MLPKTGKKFPGGNDRETGGPGYAAIVAAALEKELGDTHRAAKVLMGGRAPASAPSSIGWPACTVREETICLF